MESIIFNELSKRAYKCACEHGFHNEERSNEHWLCLVVSELMEAVEADRKRKRFKGNKNKFEKEYNRYPALVEEQKRFACAFENTSKIRLKTNWQIPQFDCSTLPGCVE